MRPRWISTARAQSRGGDDGYARRQRDAPHVPQNFLCKGGECLVRVLREKKIKKCRNSRCESDNIYEDDKQGDLVCAECGLVFGQRTISMRSEWRSFSDDLGNKADPDRAGGVEDKLYHHDKLDTAIAAGSFRSDPPDSNWMDLLSPQPVCFPE